MLNKKESYKKSYSCYYVEKRTLSDSSFRNEFCSLVKDWSLKNSLTEKIIPFSADPSMIFISFFQKGKEVANLFLRNSGTEDKSSICFRSIVENNKVFTSLEILLTSYFWKKMKKMDHSKNQTMLNIFERIHSATFLKPDEQKDVLFLMLTKEKTIQLVGEKYVLCSTRALKCPVRPRDTNRALRLSGTLLGPMGPLGPLAV